MTTTTMDLTSATAPARADRKTPAPVDWGEHLASSASASMRRHAVAHVATSMDGQPARGRPPPALLERFVQRVMLLLFVVAVVRTFGLDLLALVWRILF